MKYFVALLLLSCTAFTCQHGVHLDLDPSWTLICDQQVEGATFKVWMNGRGDGISFNAHPYKGKRPSLEKRVDDAIEESKCMVLSQYPGEEFSVTTLEKSPDEALILINCGGGVKMVAKFFCTPKAVCSITHSYTDATNEVARSKWDTFFNDHILFDTDMHR